MILKSFEIKKINKNINHFILFYGKNEGLKNEALDILITDKNNVLNYDEKEILDNENNFIEDIQSRSLFEPEKFIIIITERITTCSLDELPDHTKKWGNRLHVQKSFQLMYL